jgi:uncharacterized protein (DUF302 family)
MRVVAHINGQANAAKIGKSVPADQILEVFRPDFAVRVWQACKPAGMDIPLRIHIYENDTGNTIVAFRTASEIFAPYDSAELMEIGKELDTIFASILQVVVMDDEEIAHG